MSNCAKDTEAIVTAIYALTKAQTRTANELARIADVNEAARDVVNIGARAMLEMKLADPELDPETKTLLEKIVATMK